ncbi:MAG TPA: serpin family protein [Chthoniobacteraceae bacterium]|jgi:serpin B|nr:serpin family protein [Chthoniobacteraceae bacterium]
MKRLFLTILPALFCISAYGAPDQNWIGPAINAFGEDLYAKLAAHGKGNLFFSPAGIHTALAMTYAGARGDTAKQMAAVLHLPADNPDLQKDIGSCLKSLNEGKRPCRLSLANALWGQKGFPFLPDFLSLLKTDYGAGLQELDFRHDPQGATQTINDWVATKTLDKIQNLIAPGILTPATRLVLTNAVYFKGTWDIPFKKAETHDAPFHCGHPENVPMMHHAAEYGYRAGEGCQMLKLDYAGNDLSMIILLPDQDDGLPALEKQLADIPLGKPFARTRVNVTIPRFRLTQRFELGPVLISMGMRDAFANADFSGMDGRKDLQISNVIHKACVDVNEEGTEAAAATAVTMRALAMQMPQPPKVFTADHPFIFVIRDEKNGAILFMGRVADPRG